MNEYRVAPLNGGKVGVMIIGWYVGAGRFVDGTVMFEDIDEVGPVLDWVLRVVVRVVVLVVVRVVVLVVDLVVGLVVGLVVLLVDNGSGSNSSDSSVS